MMNGMAASRVRRAEIDLGGVWRVAIEHRVIHSWRLRLVDRNALHRAYRILRITAESNVPDIPHLMRPAIAQAAGEPLISLILPLLTGEGRTHHGEILAEATKLAEVGAITPELDPRRFTPSTVNGAYHSMKAGPARGKVVVDIGEEAPS